MPSSPQVIPITSAPNQIVKIAVLVNGQVLGLTLRVYFNGQANVWMMDVLDQLANPLVLSVPLVTGVWPGANILSPWEYLGIGSAYVINQNGVTSDIPGPSNLGGDFLLIWDSNS